MKREVCLLGIALLSTPVGAQEHQHANHAEHTAGGPVPREILERPLTLRTGIGQVNDPVGAATPEAQAFYNQGLAYLHSFAWIEAARSFQQALRLDAKLAAAYVGLARAHMGLEDMAGTQAALARAKALAPRADERQQRRVEIFSRQMDALANPTDPAKYLAYKKALDDALAREVDSPELWLWRGNAEEPMMGAAGRGQFGEAASIAFYEAAFKRQPDHFAAHHYLIHTYELLGRTDLALRHGEAYARLVPNISHAQHMYAHDLMRVGRVREAIGQFEKADGLERAYYTSENIPRDLDWHRPHNLELLALLYLHEGRTRDAERILREVRGLKPFGRYGFYYQRTLPEFLLARGRAKEALAAAEPMARASNSVERMLGKTITGRARLALGRTAEARTDLGDAEKGLAGLSGFEAWVLSPYVQALKGEMLLRSGQRAAGDSLLRAVIVTSRQMPGPDAWVDGVFRLESIARLARDAGDWKLAEFAAKQLAEHAPTYAGSHYAQALVAEQRGDKASAQSALAEAEKAWAGGDRDLPELREIRRRLRRYG